MSDEEKKPDDAEENKGGGGKSGIAAVDIASSKFTEANEGEMPAWKRGVKYKYVPWDHKRPVLVVPPTVDKEFQKMCGTCSTPCMAMPCCMPFAPCMTLMQTGQCNSPTCCVFHVYCCELCDGYCDTCPPSMCKAFCSIDFCKENCTCKCFEGCCCPGEPDIGCIGKCMQCQCCETFCCPNPPDLDVKVNCCTKFLQCDCCPMKCPGCDMCSGMCLKCFEMPCCKCCMVNVDLNADVDVNMNCCKKCCECTTEMPCCAKCMDGFGCDPSMCMRCVTCDFTVLAECFGKCLGKCGCEKCGEMCTKCADCTICMEIPCCRKCFDCCKQCCDPKFVQGAQVACMHCTLTMQLCCAVTAGPLQKEKISGLNKDINKLTSIIPLTSSTGSPDNLDMTR